MERIRLPNIVSRLQKKRSLISSEKPQTTSPKDAAVASRRDSLSPQKKTMSPQLEKRLPALPAGEHRSSHAAGANAQQPVVRQEGHEVDLPTDGNHNANSTCAHAHVDANPDPTGRSTLIDRPRRPPNLNLSHARTRGYTDIPLSNLRQNITAHAKGNADIAEQFAQPKPPKSKAKRRKTTPPQPIMGNNPSSFADERRSDASSPRNPVRVLRKSSTLLFNKRIDSKSPLPRPATATTIVVAEQTNDSLSPYGDGATNDTDAIDAFQQPAHRAKTPPPLHPRGRPSDSDLSMDADTSSPSTTIKNTKQSQAPVNSGNPGESGYTSESFADRSDTLSPTIPDIPALPEDTPHKYGLMDRVETLLPDPPSPEDEPGIKASRRGSGAELFREATSLASASSFLNGLSISRRAAESTESWTEVSRSRSRRRSSGPARPSSATQMPAGKSTDRRGHDLFKRTRFAYSRPLRITQLKCFRQHSELIRSSNKSAPVECAICHMDDDQEYYSCSWCALRMCRYCRMDFRKRGTVALTERIRKAEMGNASDDSSFEDVSRGRPAVS